MLFIIEMTPILYTELILWFVSIALLVIDGLLLVHNYRKLNNKYYLYMSGFFFIYIFGRITRLIVRFVIGEPPVGQPLVGDAFFIEGISTVFGMLALFFIVFAIERYTLKKTHYFFSIVNWITTIIAIIDLIVRTLTAVSSVLFIMVSFSVPLMFLYLAYNSTGSLRTDSLLIAFGIILFIMGVGFDIPEGKLIFNFVPDILLSIFAPTFQIVACLLLWKAFRKKE